jgi:DNA replication initiation complex subunit (GINS family)
METTLDIVNLIHNNKRSDALDKIEDLLYKRAAEVIDNYKKTVASTYFDEPVGDTENQ